VQNYPNLQRFFDYIDNNYVNGGVFPIPFWNVHNRDMDNRTNNYAEGNLTVYLFMVDMLPTLIQGGEAYC